MSANQTKVTVRIRPYRGAPQHNLVFFTDFKTDKPIRRVAEQRVRSLGCYYEIVGLEWSRTLEGVSRHV